MNPNAREWYTHECQAKPHIEQYPSVNMTADEWLAALLIDDGLYYRILDGIAKETAAFRKKYHRLPEALEYGRRSQTNPLNPERTRNVA
jgi:hypothetical protein